MKSQRQLMFASIVAAAAFAQTAAKAEDMKFSIPYEYQVSCQVCHGVAATGDGPMASELKTKPADLTTLAKRNGGEFPFLKIFQVIDGRQSIQAHGARPMPVWGMRYQEEIGEKFGPYGGEAAVRARVLELTYYLQSIQKK
jgi:mono/diheme cytochrome c family protein